MVMRTLIGGFSLFAAGLTVGMFLMQPGYAQQNQNPGLRLNHVGHLYTKISTSPCVSTPRPSASREAFSIKDKDGKPTLTYLQLGKDTFIELAPATAERPAGLSHIGFWPVDLNAAVAALRQRGVNSGRPPHRLHQKPASRT